MRLPRWALATAIALISLLALAAGYSWWTLWPIQTARTLAERLSAGDEDAVLKILPEWDWLSKDFQFSKFYNRSAEMYPLPRTASDLVRGRVRFRISGISACFVAERSVVRIQDQERFLRILALEDLKSEVEKQIEVLGDNEELVLRELRRQRELMKADNVALSQIDAELARHNEQFQRQLANRQLVLEDCRARLDDLIQTDEAAH